MENATAALVCFGEINSPKDLVARAANDARRSLEESGLKIVTTEPVSDDSERKDASRAISDLSGKEFDVLILCLTGWIPSYTVVAVAEHFREKTLVLWGLAGSIEHGTLITLAAQAGTTALRYPLSELGYRFKYFYDTIDGPSKAQDISRFVHNAAAVERLRTKRVLSVGYRDMNLYGTLYDGLSLRRVIGVEVENKEMLEMVRRSESLEPNEIQGVLEYIERNWTFRDKVEPKVLELGCRYYLALEHMVEEGSYEAVTLLDVDGMKKHLGFPPAMIFMLLADRLGVCTVPENDIMGAVTQLIVKELTGQAAAYMEFYEFMSDRVLIGVPDYVPAEVTAGAVMVTAASFGDLGAGVLNISKVKTGPITLCRCFLSGDRYYMHVATGRAVEPRKWMEAGWDTDSIQLPSLEVVLDGTVCEFAGKVNSQHTILAYGDHVEALSDYCTLTGMELVV